MLEWGTRSGALGLASRVPWISRRRSGAIETLSMGARRGHKDVGEFTSRPRSADGERKLAAAAVGSALYPAALLAVDADAMSRLSSPSACCRGNGAAVDGATARRR
jgi:hypothetical protein